MVPCDNAWLIASGPLAHAWLEQRTHNPLVPCSTHGGATRIHVAHSGVGRFAFTLQFWGCSAEPRWADQFGPIFFLLGFGHRGCVGGGRQGDIYA